MSVHLLIMLSVAHVPETLALRTVVIVHVHSQLSGTLVEASTSLATLVSATASLRTAMLASKVAEIRSMQM